MCLKGLSEKEKKLLLDLIREFADIFYLKEERLSTANLGQARVEMKNANQKPSFTKQFRIPIMYREKLRENLRDLVEKGIISRSLSPWSSPFFLIKKKDLDSEKERFRCVLDCRKINLLIKETAYSIPHLTDFTENLQEADTFSTLDLADSFLQIELEPESRKYFAFQTMTMS